MHASGDLGEGKSIPVFQKEIRTSEKGLYISWDELNLLSRILYEVIDLIAIGCKDINLLHRYDNDQDMYESCDIVIEMFDSCFWEVFSQDETFIQRLAKFKDVIFLESNFIK